MKITIQTIIKYLKVLRVSEVSLMVGFFVIGSFFSIAHFDINTILRLGLYGIGVFFFILSIYAFNAYGGYIKDRSNERLEHLQHIKAKDFLFITLGSLLIANLLFLSLNQQIWIFSILSYVFWLAYSYPSVGLKNYPIAGTIIHFITQILHFQMGYMLFKPIDKYSWMISVYFAMLFSAAHLNHELIDYKADSENKLKTSAITFGPKIIDLFSLLLFFLATTYNAYLYAKDIIDINVFLPLLAAFGIQVIAKVILSSNSHTSYRSIYRMAYFIACVFIVLNKSINYV